MMFMLTIDSLYVCMYCSLCSYDELLVGAPLHLPKDSPNCVDCGRVYVYRNNATTVSELHTYLVILLSLTLISPKMSPLT